MDEQGELKLAAEPVANAITWVYEEGSFVPCARIEDSVQYSIVADYLGTPTHAFDSKGAKVWERELDCYGAVRKETGMKGLVPQIYQGQMPDEETGLAYNRFRYYDNESGGYISQDPIGLAGGMELYGYVKDVCSYIDPLGLSECNHESVKKKIENILKKYKNKIVALDPEATVGFMGSTSTGVKGEHNGYAPFDPNSFDVDAFIMSDKLYNSEVFSKKEWWRSGSKIK